MNSELSKLIDAIISQDEEASRAHFSAYLKDKASAIISEKAQLDMFGSDDKDHAEKKFLVKPTGMGYDDKEHAIASAQNHLAKDIEIIDTQNKEVVYSHKAKNKKKKK